METTTRLLVDHSRCRRKGACVAVCPFHLFEIGRIQQGDFARLAGVGRPKTRARERRRGDAARVEPCRVCGLCLTACPARAEARRR